jgi:hypothetical protein
MSFEEATFIEACPDPYRFVWTTSMIGNTQIETTLWFRYGDLVCGFDFLEPFFE